YVYDNGQRMRSSWTLKGILDNVEAGAWIEEGARTLPQIEASTVDEVLVLTDHPRMPHGKRAVAIVLGLDAEQFQPFERFVSASQTAPVLRIGYGEDAEAQKLRADLAAAQAELARYRAAYEKNPPPEAGRFGVIELD